MRMSRNPLQIFQMPWKIIFGEQAIGVGFAILKPI